MVLDFRFVKIILCIFRIWVCVQVLACIRLLHLSLDSALSRLHCCKSFGTFWLAVPTCKQTQVWEQSKMLWQFFLAVLNKKHKNNFFLQNQWKLRKAIVVKIWVCNKCFLWDLFLTNFEEVIAKNQFSPFSTFWVCVRQEPLQPSQPVGDPPTPHQRHSNLCATC